MISTIGTENLLMLCLYLSIAQAFTLLFLLLKGFSISRNIAKDEPEKTKSLTFPKIKQKELDPVVMNDDAIIAMEDEENKKKGKY